MNIQLRNCNWSQIEFDLALQILIKLFEAKQNEVEDWKQYAQKIETFNCASCKWRRQYYLKQVEQLLKAFYCIRFSTNYRLVMTDFLRKIKKNEQAIQNSNSKFIASRYSFLLEYDQLPEKLSLIVKMIFLLKIVQPISKETHLLLRELSYEQSLNSNCILRQFWPEECDYTISYARNLCLKNDFSHGLIIIDDALKIKQLSSFYDFSMLHFQRGNILGCMGKEKEAFKSYRIATKGKIATIQCQQRLATALRQYGNIIKINEFIKNHKSCLIPPSFKAYYTYYSDLNNPSQFFNGLKKLEALTNSTYNLYHSRNFLYYNFYIGVYKFHSFRFEQSFSYFQKELEEQKNSRLVLTWISFCCDQIQKSQLALFYHQRLRQISQNTILIDVYIAADYVKLGEYAIATKIMNTIDTSLLQQYNNCYCFLLAMQIYNKLGQYYKVIQYYTLYQPKHQIQKVQALITMIITSEKLKDQQMALRYYDQIQMNNMYNNCYPKQFAQICFLLDYGYRHNDWSKRKNLLQKLEEIRIQMKIYNSPGCEYFENLLSQRLPTNIELMLII